MMTIAKNSLSLSLVKGSFCLAAYRWFFPGLTNYLSQPHLG